MINLKDIAPILLVGVCICGQALRAQESGALIDALIRKGILTHQEAEDIRADLVRENNVVPADVHAGGKSTDRLTLGMRMQMQYANLTSDTRGESSNPASTNRFFLRRMYLTMKAGVGGNWGATMTYDLASGGYDDAIIEWKPKPDLAFNFGLRKVNVGYEERATSGNLKAIERSGVTRYFVESNNGRRLGAASYRIGAFVDGRRNFSDQHGLVYSAAITTPDRNETFTLASASGDATNNRAAFWGNLGLTGKLRNGSWIAGVGAGFLPDQGGAGVANLGRGFDLSIYSVYTDITAGWFGFMAEYLTADIERGAPANDARPTGFYLQPSIMLTERLEAVVRYQSLDTDGRGVTLSDVVRSAPAAGTMNYFAGWYVGANWYLRGNDLKYQLGAVYGRTKGSLTGAPAEASTVGLRSQMQVQF
jgi:polyhydroxyalkanoate synthesis regulator phasin